MTHLVFKELGGLNKIASNALGTISLVSASATIVISIRQINFNFSATATTVFVVLHVVVQFDKGVVVTSRSNIKHQTQLRLQILANALEKPFMRVNFTVVPVLDTETNMDAPSFEHIVTETYVPGGHLEDMQEIVRHVFIFYIFIHNVSQWAH